jgi:hypothetical protein
MLPAYWVLAETSAAVVMGVSPSTEVRLEERLVAPVAHRVMLAVRTVAIPECSVAPPTTAMAAAAASLAFVWRLEALA